MRMHWPSATPYCGARKDGSGPSDCQWISDVSEMSYASG